MNEKEITKIKDDIKLLFRKFDAINQYVHAVKNEINKRIDEIEKKIDNSN